VKGRILYPLEPGSPEWYRTMSASKVAAVVGLSPYQSRFSLWHRMAGLVEPEPQNESMARGHYLEDGIARWFAAQHPDFDVTPATHWGHAEVEWATATPDRDLCTPTGQRILEIKADDSPDWDPTEGVIPPGYYCQVQWQLLCSGLDVAHVAHLGAFLRFDEYVIEANAQDQDYLMAQASEFMDSLPWGTNPKRPDLDEHDATYDTVKRLKPGVGDGDIEVSAEVADAYLSAMAAAKEANAAKVGACSRLLDLLNECDARRATFDGKPIASKRPGRNGAPAYLQASPIPKASKAA